MSAAMNDTGELLDAVERFVEEYVVLPGDAERAAVTLFVCHTWAIFAAHATPYIVVVSPERRTGKTRLLEVLTLLVREPWHATSPTEAVLFRKIAKDCPTLLLDEIDAVFGSSSERTEPIRAILNAGNRPGATIPRCIGKGSEQRVEDFAVFCCKVLCGIDTGRLPDTIRDRAIVIHMKRRHPGEPVRRLRIRDAEREVTDLHLWLADWSERVELHDAEPDLPDELNDRAADAWEPLFAIADLAGGGWGERARAAAVRLSAEDEDGATHGTRLLAATRVALDGEPAIFSADLVEAINAHEDLPYGGWNDGDGLKPRDLARYLRPYGIKPKKVRVGDATRQGYHRDDLRDPFSRYLPQEAEQAEQAEHVPDPERENPRNHGDVPDVPDVPDYPGSDGAVTDEELRERAERLARRLEEEPA